MPKMPSPANGGNGHGCHHFWLIESARGETSNGICQYCGEFQVFKNWVPSIHLMGGDPEKSSKGGRRKNGGANSYAYIPVLREFEGGIY